MAMAITVPHYTVNDLANFPDDGNRYELLDGVLLVTPGPNTGHQVMAARIQARLAQAVQLPGLACGGPRRRGPAPKDPAAARHPRFPDEL